MQALLTGIAIALLLSDTGQAQTQARNAITPETAGSPKAKVAPQVLPAKANLRSKSDAERQAYSDMVDHVAASAADFADDNTTENQGRDHLADPAAEASKEDTGPKSPAARKGKAP